MTPRQLQLGIAVVAAVAVVALFFIFNPFASQNPLNPIDATSSPSSLVVQDAVVGSGPAAQAGDTITVNYTGKLQDGSVFDTSVGKTPYTFVLGSGAVIPGWDQGLVGMHAGGKRILIIPPSLAYGAQGNGPIPPNATLLFEVDLVSVTPGAGTPFAPEGPGAE